MQEFDLRKNQDVLIGTGENQIRVRVCKVGASCIKLGVLAPQTMNITRGEKRKIKAGAA